MLELRGTKNQIVGTVSVRLELNSPGPLDPTAIQEDIAGLQSVVHKTNLVGGLEHLQVEASPVDQMTKNTRVLVGEISSNGLKQLEGAAAKLGKLLEALKLVITAMDEASKVHSLLNPVFMCSSLILSLRRFIPTHRQLGLLSHRCIRLVCFSKKWFIF